MSLTDQHYNLFGISAVYNASDDFPKAVTIIMDEENDSVPKSGVNALSHMAKINVRQSEVAKRPDSDGSFTVVSTDGTEQTWNIRPDGVGEIMAEMGFDAEWSCDVQRNVRPGFRR